MQTSLGAKQDVREWTLDQNELVCVSNMNGTLAMKKKECSSKKDDKKAFWMPRR